MTRGAAASIGFRSRARDAIAERPWERVRETTEPDSADEIARGFGEEYDLLVPKKGEVQAGVNGMVLRAHERGAGPGGREYVVKLAFDGREQKDRIAFREAGGRCETRPLAKLEAPLSLYIDRHLRSVPFFMRVFDAANADGPIFGAGVLGGLATRGDSIVVAERIRPGVSLYNAANDRAVVAEGAPRRPLSERDGRALLAMLAAGLALARDAIGFRHRDLHGNNVLLREMPAGLAGVVFRDRAGAVRYLPLAAGRYAPAVIDYGWSAVEGMDYGLTSWGGCDSLKSGRGRESPSSPKLPDFTGAGDERLDPTDDLDRLFHFMPRPAAGESLEGYLERCRREARANPILGPAAMERVAERVTGRLGAADYERDVERFARGAGAVAGLGTMRPEALAFVGYRDDGDFADRTREAERFAAASKGARPPARELVSWRRVRLAGVRGRARELRGALGAVLGAGGIVDWADPEAYRRAVWTAGAVNAARPAGGAFYAAPSVAAALPRDPSVPYDHFIVLSPAPIPGGTRVVVRHAWVAPRFALVPPLARFVPSDDGASLLEVPPYESVPAWRGAERPGSPAPRER